MKQGDRAVLQLAACHALGVQVRDLLQLQRALQRDGIAKAATEVHEVVELAVLLRELLDLLFPLDQLTDLVRKGPQGFDQLVPALERDAPVDSRQAKGQEAEADHVCGESLGRRNADLRA